MTELHELKRAEETLKDGNRNALYSNILDTCSGMRTKLQKLMSGELKRAVSVFSDPNYPKKQLRIIQTVEDGRLRTSYWMDDSNVWAYCKRRREEFDEHRKHAATTGNQNMFREYFLSSWLLETYILLKYGIDLRGNTWNDPTSSDFRKVNWIIDRDPFASRYKLTTYMESLNMTDPFNDISVEMSGLDLSFLKDDDKPQEKPLCH